MHDETPAKDSRGMRNYEEAEYQRLLRSLAQTQDEERSREFIEKRIKPRIIDIAREVDSLVGEAKFDDNVQRGKVQEGLVEAPQKGEVGVD